MSWQQQPAEGEYGTNVANNATGDRTADGVHRGNGEPQNPPNVYHPYADTAPEYDRYADPAAAHGWQNAYDETRELPLVIPDDHGPSAARADGGSRRRARSAPRSRLPRRAAFAAGAVGAVGVAVALAGAFGSGSSGAPGGAEQSPRPKVARSESPTEGSVPGTAGPSGSVEPAAGAGTAPASGAPRGAAPAGSGTSTPSAATTAARTPSASPSVTASATGPGYFGHKPGRGHGGTKGSR
ncbi:hypothetical protein [Streptomyces hygroscopicus]|uniref:hypothetical protein n=1 Tax=Streptomyces hygroscopicus TaxID=1912 RepID=UPI00223F3862|nr:hypothetical protein [Streptomyces hygroscopicus]